MKTFILSISFLFIGLVSMAQGEFRGKADIPEVTEAGFYRIRLRPALTTELQSDWADLRMFDQEGETVPYLLCKTPDSIPADTFAYSDWEYISMPKGKTRLRFSSHKIPSADQLVVRFNGPKYFHRKAEVYTLKGKQRKSRRKHRRRRNRHYYTLTPEQNTVTVDWSYYRNRDLFLQISNRDNPALSVASVQLVQQPRYLVAWLEPDKTYNLYFGCKGVRKPNFDLGRFKSEIPDTLAVLDPVLGRNDKRSLSAMGQWPSWVIWLGLVLLVLGVGFGALRMINTIER